MAVNLINNLKIEEPSIEKACEEFNNNIRLTLSLINDQLNDALVKGFKSIENLRLRIAARQIFLEKKPNLLSLFSYSKKSTAIEPLQKFKEIQISLNNHFERIKSKINETENIHTTLLQLIAKNSRDEKLKSQTKTQKNNREGEYTNCADFSLIYDKENFDSVTIRKNAYSNASLNLQTSFDPPIKGPLFSDIPANVERRKPLENIHSRLIKQLEATDSLEGFLKLMNRKPKQYQNNIQEKYTNSLYFFPAKNKSGKNNTNSKTKSNYCSVSINQEKNKRLSNRNLNQKSLKCYDLLDELKIKDLKPIASEYPRRDIIHSTQITKRKTYLHRIMEENEEVWKRLLHPIQIETDRKHLKNKNVKNLMTYLTAPKQKILSNIPQTLVVMPVKISYDNFPTKDTENLPNIEQHPKAKTTPTQNSTKKKEMLKQLRSLKVRNDNIQKNIQKAIDVIESKMIDIITSPKKDDSRKAFSDMEIEITNVLKLIKEPLLIDKPEKDINKTISSPHLKKDPMPELLKNESLNNTGSIAKSEKKIIHKCANIEEGERLLDQVDNVIQKIDSIYTKLSEDAKTKITSPNISPINHAITFIIGEYEQSTLCNEEALCYYQNQSYNYIKLICPYNKPYEAGDCHRKHTQTHEIQKNVSISETLQIVRIPDETKCVAEHIFMRHDKTLKTFYTLFFSSIFLVLKLDYTA